MKIITAAAVTACLLPMPVGAVDLTVFGFELGKAVSLPECVVTSTVYISPQLPKYKLYGQDQARTCVEQREPEIGRINQRTIMFSKKDAPSLSKDRNIYALFADKSLIGVLIFTSGIDSQQYCLQVLTSKYGKPTTVTIAQVQNRFGAKFDVIHAAWNFPGLDVSLEGAGPLLDSGTINVDTPEATKRRAEDAAKVRQQGTKL